MYTLPNQTQLSDQITKLPAGVPTPPEGPGLCGVVGCAVTQEGSTSATYTIVPFGSDVTQDTPFLLASGSKTFKATLYAMWFLGLNPYSQNLPKTPVIDLFPNLMSSYIGIPPFHFPYFPTLTFDQLATYSSGLPSHNKNPTLESTQNPYMSVQTWNCYRAANFIADLANIPPVFLGAYLYSDMGFSLLGMLMDSDGSSNAEKGPRAIAPQIGSTYQEVLQSTILDPLGMSSTFL